MCVLVTTALGGPAGDSRRYVVYVGSSGVAAQCYEFLIIDSRQHRYGDITFAIAERDPTRDVKRGRSHSITDA